MKREFAAGLAALALASCLSETKGDRAAQNEVQEAAQYVAGTISKARSLAAQRRTNVELQIFPADRKFVTARETAPGVFTQMPEFEYSLGPGYTIAVEGAHPGLSAGEQVVTFAPSGVTKAATITVTHRSGAWRKVHVDEAGHVKIEEPEL